METKGKGTTILVMGILGIICCQFLGPVAWIMGNNAMAETTDPNEQNLINIGRILGIIGTVLLILSFVWVLFFGGLAMLTAGAGAGAAAGAGAPVTP